MRLPVLNRKLFGFLLFALMPLSLFARETVSPVRAPESYVLLGGIAELRDDVYSGDINMAGEFAPCNCFSVYGDFAYRLVSYEWNTMAHDQIHERVNLQVNGLNESYLGVKLMPFSFAGVDVNWRLPPREGSRVNRFYRIGVTPYGLYDVSRRMTIGAALEYLTFLEERNFQPGDELGLKGSFSWKLLWDSDEYSGWKLDYVILYRWRIQESRNLNLDKPYQKMDDLERGFRLRVDAAHYFSIFRNSLGAALFYEMNRGHLFGMETGHTLGIYAKFMFL
ncbi:hypothetical protein SAMN05720473_10482 [Fibrobacter sp. UWB15]|jgi:hypothetical protein|uniref:hypothetical protein n=1 Tax=unclassified Fibrobacter TaxID=2634177 RepID=UPI00090F16E0|nr:MULTISPECIES: hypothetical protein [unclassified Fibrobacter]PWJ64207.1 hypothetical protein BGW99_106124 [Fibrobacter sp. UWB6]SHG23589.1 hypothetical protein SAMN05720760_106123 [Fibrobacter sp. UWB8]SMG28115.1 hypothetical protein SAMN05720473_10482 [Fibrobacter sp. UWB15]